MALASSAHAGTVSILKLAMEATDSATSAEGDSRECHAVGCLAAAGGPGHLCESGRFLRVVT
jgi:hypothetical protein